MTRLIHKDYEQEDLRATLTASILNENRTLSIYQNLVFLSLIHYCQLGLIVTVILTKIKYSHWIS